MSHLKHLCRFQGRGRLRQCLAQRSCIRSQQNWRSYNFFKECRQKRTPSREWSISQFGLASLQTHHERGSLHISATKAKAEASPTQEDTPSSILTLPTMLTLTRVLAIPALIAVWFGTSSSTSPFFTAGIFLAACITDFLDGYLARKMGSHSPFGAFLDPVADKLMVSTVLILLSSKPFVIGAFAGNTWFMPTIASAIIGREIAMSALREWAASLGSEAHKAVAVSPLGKWKTTTQMTSLIFLLLSSGGANDSIYIEACASFGPPLLGVATFLTLFSFYQYLRGLWKYLI